MTRTSARLLLWAPRVLGIAVCLFIGMFALDAFSEGRPLSGTIPAFLIHLIPALMLLVTVALSWRWEWVGGITFVTLATLYAVMVSRNHPDWMFIISGPLLVVGALFLWSWRHHGELRSPRA